MDELEDLRELAHKLVDDMFNYYEKLRSQPVWKEPTKEMKEKFLEPLPEKGSDLDTIYKDFKDYILPFNQGNIHPRYYSWIQGAGMPLGAIADFLASFLNANVSIGDHSARYIDSQVVEWSKTMFNFPKKSSGLLVSGSSMANLTAIIAAINVGKDECPNNKKLIIYASKETHKCIHKAIQVTNVKALIIREVRVNNDFEIDCDLLEKKIKIDIKNDYVPYLLVGNFGTVNTGSIDSLDKLIEIKNTYSLWLHIDGAYGAPAILTKKFKKYFDLFKGIDSLAFDFHKLFNINYAAGCVLIRKDYALKNTFNVDDQPYLMRGGEGISGGLSTTDSLGFEVSRDFNALKIWMILKNKGVSAIAEMIESRMALAKYLAQRIETDYSSELKVVAPVVLSVVCLKFIKKEYSVKQLNIFHKEVVVKIQKSGKSAPSITIINEEVVIRISIINFKTEEGDIDDLLKNIIDEGRTHSLNVKID